MNNYRRIIALLELEMYTEFRVKLAREGKTISSWVREKVEEYVAG